MASENHGIVTTRDAEEAGVPAVALRKLAQRGVLRQVARGVYLHAQVPRDRFTDMAEAVSTVGHDGYVEWDAVLSLCDLALVDPPFVRVGVNRRYRGAPRQHVRVTRRRSPLTPRDLTYDEGVRGVTVERALLDALDQIPLDRVLQAVTQAEVRGLLTTDEAVGIRAMSRSPHHRRHDGAVKSVGTTAKGRR
ncbi:MAG: type IV toxin-antitoxin system AbiEi family antitoxin domain-containing protein [Micrococcus sp.]|nr:type IV toxin-antitoxin system AbiEi family antitoxin domain-containing protein [Micrococcus sp.]